MKSISYCFVIVALLCLSEPVAAMSVDQNCTMVIEFNDGRVPVTVPTNEIRSITFKPAFSGTIRPPIKPTEPIITPRKPNQPSGGLRGTWRGPYTNSRNEPGTDDFVLVETNGVIEGTHGGLKILDGRRWGNEMTWRMERDGGFAKGGCSWNVKVSIEEGGNLLVVDYTGQDHRTDKNDGGRYTGHAKARKIR